jgi:hypothetical protein
MNMYSCFSTITVGILDLKKFNSQLSLSLVTWLGPLYLLDGYTLGNRVHDPLHPVKTSSLHLLLYYFDPPNLLISSTVLYLLV